MHIVYRKKDGHEYASAGRSVRNGDKVKKEYVYLGKVLDKEKGIYENRKMGVIGFDLEKGVFTSPALDDIPRREPDEKLILDFGDAYFLDLFMRSSGIMECVDAAGCSVPDSLRSLVLYYILSREASCNAGTWYEGSYARILYPDADMDGRRISEIFRDVGDESKWRSFFSAYMPMVTGGSGDMKVIIDSSGLPNSAHMDITAVNTHRGVTSDEVRLILVVDKDTSMPVFMRYVPGNVIDLLTLVRTMAELKTQGVKCSYALLDSGYCNENNIAELYNAGIDFITRLTVNRTLYEELKENVFPGIECRENFTVFNERQLFVKRTECELAPGRRGFAYAVLDADRKYLENGRMVRRAGVEGLTDTEVYDSMTGSGFFVLISSMELENSEVLPDYYVRQTMEQFIDVGKNYTNLLPLRVHSEETFRGHLLISFIASAAVQMLSNELKARGRVREHKKNNGKKNNAPTVVSALMSLRNQKCKVYDDVILPSEPQAIANKAYKLFGVDVPYAIPHKKVEP